MVQGPSHLIPPRIPTAPPLARGRLAVRRSLSLRRVLGRILLGRILLRRILLLLRRILLLRTAAPLLLRRGLAALPVSSWRWLLLLLLLLLLIVPLTVALWRVSLAIRGRGRSRAVASLTWVLLLLLLITAAGRRAALVVAKARRHGRLVRLIAGCGRGRQVVVLGFAIAALQGRQVARLRLRPQGSRHLAMAEAADGIHPPAAATMRVSVPAGLLGLAGHDVVLAVLDRLGVEQVVQFMAAGILVGPHLHRLVHVALHLDAFVAHDGVVERTDDVVDDFFHGNARVFPCIDDTTLVCQLKRLSR